MIDFDGSDLLDKPAPSRSYPTIDSGFENEDEFLEEDLNNRYKGYYSIYSIDI